jgi:phosphate transport system permease protein
VQLEVVDSWTVLQALFERDSIEAELAADNPNAELQWHSWLDMDFLVKPMSSTPALAGIRTALLGSLWMLAITMLVAVPLGVGAAIYLEEYADDTWYNNIIETNIRNLAGVPSIIYGMLGLAIFVRSMEDFTSGAMFGVTESNGRTIISASFTLALLILPIIIINAQEAIRAVPWSIREGSYGLGATKWQTIWRQVLPAGLPGILTGTILSLSRAIGETAPLIVIGASAVIFTDPNGPFAKFTALPIQIWQWTARPQDQFRDIAAAAIVVLLVLLLLLNTTAIVLRQRFSRRLW